ncbi:LacI family DNA-binding transcriptional regulator [Nocardia sp. NPDC005978]|uniref:LacI family DNA-binding transcriptional regulator n=1 Tax=Nocardia sp. NPDC005978 TaxID=3156725 RepID=UPI0033AE99DF
MTAKRVTLADVAAHAGTSTAVVSYVLNDGPRPVSEALRAKVLRALDELQYRPDRIARALRRPGRWRQIGLLVPDLTLPLFGTLVGRIELEARRRDHLTLIGNTGYDPDRELEFVEAFAGSGIDGLIVVGGANGPATAKVCARERIPIVWAHNNRDHVDSPLVGADHVAAGALAARHLLEAHGRREIAFVGGFTAEDVVHGDRETVAQRHAGYATVVGAADARVVRTDLTPHGAYASVIRYLATEPAPRGMVVGTYGQAAAVLRAIADSGLRTPEDIAVVGFDADARNSFGQPVLTTVQQPIDVIARAALDRILSPATAATPVVDVRLETGETCGCGIDPMSSRNHRLAAGTL